MVDDAAADEGTDKPETAGSEGETPDGVTQTPEVKSEEKDTFDRKYVEALRAEAAGHRVRANEAEAALASAKRDEMSELERANADRDGEKQLRLAAEETLAQERLTNFVLSMADAFIDPQDVVDRIDLRSITVTDDGTPHKGSVKGLLDSIAKDKPYLLKASESGSGDGGTRSVVEVDQTIADQVEAEKKSLVDSGAFVEIPGM